MRKALIFLLFLFLLAACQTTQPTKITKTEEEKVPSKSIKKPSPVKKPAEVSIEKERPKPQRGRIPIRREIPLVSKDVIDKYIKGLTLKEKVGQLFISWIPGDFITNRAVKIIKEGRVGGIILNRMNIKSRDQVRAFITRLQQVAEENIPPIKLFISADQEGGRVARFRFREFTKFPAAYYWGEHDDPYFVEAVAYITGKELLSIGCNMDFAPVLDLYRYPDSTVIGDRSMGADVKKVSMLGRYYIFGAHEAGIIPVIKHFPGHGVTTIDSHKRLPVVDVTEKELMSREVIPFEAAIEGGADVVMTAHILYRKIDPDNPVTMSKKIVDGILRKRLGFQGVVISDAIEMGALTKNHTMEDILLKTINAGVDIILVNSRYDVLKLEDMVIRFYREGKIKEETIDESVKRIIMLKLKYGLVDLTLAEQKK